MQVQFQSKIPSSHSYYIATSKSHISKSEATTVTVLIQSQITNVVRKGFSINRKILL